MIIKKRVVATAAAAATALAGFAVVQSAGAATVDVNGELCTYTYTQADADYVNVAIKAVHEIQDDIWEAGGQFSAYIYAPELEPGESTVVRVGDAVRDAEWDEYSGVTRTVDQAINTAKDDAIWGINYHGNDPDAALLISSWGENGQARLALLNHEINKACAAGIDTETSTPEDPEFSPDKFPKWDTGEDTETSTPATETEAPETTTQEPEPTEDPNTEAPTTEPQAPIRETVVVTTTVNGTPATVTSTVTSTVTKEPAPATETPTVTEPVETTTQAPEPSEEPSSEGSSEGVLPLALIAGLVAIIAAVAPFALPQLQAFFDL